MSYETIAGSIYNSGNGVIPSDEEIVNVISAVASNGKKGTLLKRSGISNRKHAI